MNKTKTRPQTTKHGRNDGQNLGKTINDIFNEKLIQHGTSKGVPTSELPSARAGAMRNHHAQSGTTAASESVKAHLKTLTRPSSINISGGRQVKPREHLAG